MAGTKDLKMSNDAFLKNLMSAVSAADNYRARSEYLVRENLNNQKLVEILSSTEFGMECLAGAHMYLQSGLDSFFSFRLLALPDGIPDPFLNQQIRFQITNNGCATLLRQSLECLVKSNWLLADANLESVNAKGFAVAWENSRQRIKFERAINSQDLDAQIEIHKNLEFKGIEEGYLISLDSGKTNSLKFPFQDTTSLLRGISSPLDLPKEVLSRMGKGFQNAEWTYHWLSGLSHGLSWVHPFKPLGINEAFAVQNVFPDSEKFAHVAIFVLEVGQMVFSELEGNFEANLNH